MMKIELNKKQERAVKAGRIVEVRDPATAQVFIVVARDQSNRVRAGAASNASDMTPGVIPVGIRQSQEAYWRDLPALLKMKSRTRQWVAYHSDRRVGFGRTSTELYQKCIREHGLKKDQFYIDRLEPRQMPPWEAEEIDAPFCYGELADESPVNPHR